jgi:hypothetical protein
MDIIFCDVIGCSTPADRLLSDGLPPAERLCAYHWSRLQSESPDRASRFVAIDQELAAGDFRDRDTAQESVPN